MLNFALSQASGMLYNTLSRDAGQHSEPQSPGGHATMGVNNGTLTTILHLDDHSAFHF